MPRSILIHAPGQSRVHKVGGQRNYLLPPASVLTPYALGSVQQGETGPAFTAPQDFAHLWVYCWGPLVSGEVRVLINEAPSGYRVRGPGGQVAFSGPGFSTFALSQGDRVSIQNAAILRGPRLIQLISWPSFPLRSVGSWKSVAVGVVS